MRLVIFVSLRMAASAEAPSSPMLLQKRLPSEGQIGNGERSGVSAGADRNNKHSGAAAHLRSVIFVSLRTAASMEAPLGPMSLPARLQGMGEVWG